MILSKTIPRIKYIVSRFQKIIPDFYGVFDSFDKVNDENPWNKTPWIEGNINKLEKLPSGHFLLTHDVSLVDQSHTLLPALLINNFCAEKEQVTILDWGGRDRFLVFFYA